MSKFLRKFQSCDYSCEMLSLAVLAGLSALSRFWLIMYAIALGCAVWLAFVGVAGAVRHGARLYESYRRPVEQPSSPEQHGIVHI